MEKHNVQRKELEKIYGKISPFEFKDKLISLAKGDKKKSTRTLLDAGRGNPNWTAATPREAFFTFGQFAVSECRRIWDQNDLAGMPHKKGIAGRLDKFIRDNPNLPGINLLKNIIDLGISKYGFNPDSWVHELADGIIGDNYPFPDRMLIHIEKIVHDYLLEEMCYNEKPNGKFNLFAVEGATAAMCYIFDSLISNKLLKKGDKIAIMTPIFTPYLEIPLLPRYDFQVVKINASGENNLGSHSWQYPKDQLRKLCDTSIKALFVVNPSNPPSVAISAECTKELINIINNHNPNLMIISDDVYGTFVDKFHSLASSFPFNSISVYSFSKYFGVTGWRLGIIGIHEENIYDKLLKELSLDEKEELNKRYEALSSNPESISFIDRIVADSRHVALNHTAGLSTPQQVQMAFFAAFDILDNKDTYKNLTKNICRRRQRLLFNSLKLKLTENDYDAAYYTAFDLLEWAEHNYGTEFANYLQKNYKPVDVLYRLAEESSIVLLSGGGFSGPEWSIRISLANLNDEAYETIGTILHKILEGYVVDWKNSYIK